MTDLYRSVMRCILLLQPLCGSIENNVCIVDTGFLELGKADAV